MVKYTMELQTRFTTGRAMFIHWMFSNRALGDSGRTGQQGGQAVMGGKWQTRLLQAGGGYGTIGQQAERLQPGSKGAGSIKHTQAGGDLRLI
jgi:hypothetical protein